MMSKSRKLIAIVFCLTTLGSTLLIGYSLTYYVEVSLAIRSTFAYIQDFEVELVDEDHIVISTNVVVNNSTPFQFTLLWVEENVYVNQTRAGTKYEIFPENHPLVIPPQAEINHKMEIHLYVATARPEVAQILSVPLSTKVWFAIVDIYCDAPLVGRIKLSASANKETH